MHSSSSVSNTYTSFPPLEKTISVLLSVAQREQHMLPQFDENKIRRSVSHVWRNWKKLTEQTTKAQNDCQYSFNDTYSMLMTPQEKCFIHLDFLIDQGTFKSVSLAIYLTMDLIEPAVYLRQKFDNCKSRYFATQEQRILTYLNHTGTSDRIVKLFHSRISAKRAHFYEELCPGGNLIHSLEIRSITLNEKWIYLHNILQILKNLNENQVVNGDFKPDNLLINSNGELKLGDFGFSYFFNEKWHFGGTKQYITPEQMDIIEGRLVALDQSKINSWGAGCCLYMILNQGVTPWHRCEGFNQKLLAIQELWRRLNLRKNPIDRLLCGLLHPDQMERVGASEALELAATLSETDVKEWVAPRVISQISSLTKSKSWVGEDPVRSEMTGRAFSLSWVA